MSSQVQDDIQAPSEESQGKASAVLVIFLVIPMLGILAALLMIASEMQAKRQALPDYEVPTFAGAERLINFQAPPFRLNSLAGDDIALTDYTGKILFLNFWQTTCVPCITEMPEFTSFFADQNPDEVALLAINVDETPEMVSAFFETYDISGIPVAFDSDSQIRQDYGVVGFPVTFVINQSGVVRFMNIGALSYDDLEEYLELMRNPEVNSAG